MRSSQLFTKTRKEAPTDEQSKNAQLLIRAGFVHKEMAGVYTFLPLGLRVLENINQIIREEMNAIGGQEIKLTTLQDPEIWKASDRWDDDKVDIWFKTKLKNGTELGLGPTHEEPLVRALKPFVRSYKDLPLLIYQIQTKFRNEMRAKSGVMRGREFLMKDLYSFARNQEEHEAIYEKVKQSYFKVFERLGIGDKTFLTFASGGIFSRFSHEFQTICDAGEDTIFLDSSKNIAVNEEVYSHEALEALGLKQDGLKKLKSAESANIFTLGDKFSKAGGLTFIGDNGKEQDVLMGCYGIGPSRLVGVIAEVLSDKRGLVWPVYIAPYKIYLASIGEDERVRKAADELYEHLGSSGLSVLYDDRDVRPGEKFADADLIGIPTRVVVSEKTLADQSVEIKKRNSEDVNIVKITEVVDMLYKTAN